jgi:hypothetical protein
MISASAHYRYSLIFARDTFNLITIATRKASVDRGLSRGQVCKATVSKLIFIHETLSSLNS